MKKLLLSISILFFLFSFRSNDPIRDIVEKRQKINSSIESYKKVTNQDINVYKDLNKEKYSYESTNIYRLAKIDMDRYFDNGKLKKAVLTFEGDRESLISEYYFWDESLIFVFKSLKVYDQPKWKEEFDSSKVRISENKYFFQNKKLIKWIDSNKKPVDLRTINSKIYKEIIHDATLYMEIGK